MVPLTELENLPSDVIPDVGVSTAEEARKADAIDAMLPEGYYTVVLRKWDFARRSDGAIDPGRVKLIDQEIIESDEPRYTGRHVRFLTLFTTAYTRGTVRTSGLDQYLKGIDDEVDWYIEGNNKQSLINAAGILNDAVANQTPIRVKFQWSAFDRDYYEAQGGPNLEKGEEQKAIRRSASLRGMANFPVNDAGYPIPEWEGPSGSRCEAELQVDRVVPSSKRR